MPPGLTPRTAMIYGTAGFTAAQSVAAIRSREIEPDEVSILSDPMGHDPRDSITRWSALVGPLLAPIVVGPPLHRRYAA